MQNYICGCPVGARPCSNTLIHGRTQSKRRGPREQAPTREQMIYQASMREEGDRIRAREPKRDQMREMIDRLFGITTEHAVLGVLAPAAPVPAARRAPGPQPVTISPTAIAGAMRDVASAVQQGQLQAVSECAERDENAARSAERQVVLPSLASEIKAATESAASESRLDRQRDYLASLEYLADRGIRL